MRKTAALFACACCALHSVPGAVDPGLGSLDGGVFVNPFPGDTFTPVYSSETWVPGPQDLPRVLQRPGAQVSRRSPGASSSSSGGGINDLMSQLNQIMQHGSDAERAAIMQQIRGPDPDDRRTRSPAGRGGGRGFDAGSERPRDSASRRRR